MSRIRRQPFSVVLLDEFEKADPGVWDLFLQVFDDGRLSDPRGAVADFRHAVIIMTSNLGAKIPTGSGIGFSPATGFASGSVEKAVTKAFRREFLNRIDRVVVFRPLSRPVMREILAGELEAVLARRGLRSRQWAVEFDDSALEFLLSQGFTPDLGARPLKRAVERHFLTPLALAIAGHETPGGDQFLFVRAGGDGLTVTFEDPDAPEVAVPPAPSGATLRTLAREGGAGLELLEDAFASVSERVEAPAWQAEKAALLARLGEPGSGTTRAGSPCSAASSCATGSRPGCGAPRSLMRRLRNARHQPAALVRRAAQRLILLDAALDALAAGEPADARLHVEGDPEFGPRSPRCTAAWAHERGMRLEVAEERAGRRGSAGRRVGDRLRRAAHARRRSPASTCWRSRTAAAATTAAACACTVTPLDADPAGRPRHDRPPLPRAPDAARPRRRPRLAHRPARRRARRWLRPRGVEAGGREREHHRHHDQGRGQRRGVGEHTDRQRRQQDGERAREHGAARRQLRAVGREAHADGEPEREEVADAEADHGADRSAGGLPAHLRGRCPEGPDRARHLTAGESERVGSGRRARYRREMLPPIVNSDPGDETGAE